MDDMPAGYVNLATAVVLTKRSEKTVRNWADRKLVGKMKWQGLSLFRRRDLETQLAKEAEVQIVRNPAGPPMVARMGGAIAAAVAEQFSRILPATPIVPLVYKPRVTMREAVQLGYRAADLASRVKDGTLENVGSPRRYRFRRRDLDAL